MSKDHPKVIDYVNNLFDVRDLYQEVTGRKAPTGKCFCCFHSNFNSPAAKIYENHLHCFVCKRQFHPYDFLKKFFPEKLTEIVETHDIPEVDKPTKRNKVRKVQIPEGATTYQALKHIKDTYESNPD